MAQYQAMTEPIRRKIEDELGSDCIVTDPKVLKAYDRDASELVHCPELVIRPQTADQIQQLLRIHDTSVLCIPEDVAVPLNRIAELVSALPEFEAQYHLKIFAYKSNPFNL